MDYMLSKMIWITIFFIVCFFKISEQLRFIRCYNDDQFYNAVIGYGNFANVQGIVPILAVNEKSEHFTELIQNHFITDAYVNTVHMFIQVNISCSRTMTCTRDYLKGKSKDLYYPEVIMMRDGILIEGRVTRDYKPGEYDKLFATASKNPPTYKYGPEYVAQGIQRCIQEKADVKILDKADKETQTGRYSGIRIDKKPVESRNSSQKRKPEIDLNKLPDTEGTSDLGAFPEIIPDYKKRAAMGATSSNYEGVRPYNYWPPTAYYGANQGLPTINRPTAYGANQGLPTINWTGIPYNGRQESSTFNWPGAEYSVGQGSSSFLRQVSQPQQVPPKQRSPEQRSSRSPESKQPPFDFFNLK